MEDKSVLEKKRLKEILTGVNAKYRAMPRAVLKILAVMLLLLAVVFGMILVSRLHAWLVVAIPFYACFVILGWIVIRYGLFDLPANGFGDCPLHDYWLRHYWQRNVVGNTLWLWRTGEQGLNGTVLRRGVEFDRKAHLPAMLSRPIAIIGIPLGGWFRRGGEGIRFTDPTGLLADSWTLHNSGTTISLVSMTDTDAEVEMRGMDGKSKLTFPVLVALEFVERFAEVIDMPWAVTHAKPDWLFGTPSRMMADLLKVQAELELKMSREKAISIEEFNALSFNMICRIDATSRFGHSTEGQKLRAELTESLLARLAQNDPRRSVVEAINVRHLSRRARKGGG